MLYNQGNNGCLNSVMGDQDLHNRAGPAFQTSIGTWLQGVLIILDDKTTREYSVVN